MKKRHMILLFPILILMAVNACGIHAHVAEISDETSVQPTKRLKSRTPTIQPTTTITPTRTPDTGCVLPDGERSVALVVDVIDGDTIDVLIDGKIYRVRYIGIDTPESFHPGGDIAKAANGKLVLGQHVALVRDVSETDDYGRLLRYVFVEGLFVNFELVRLGYAEAGSWPPDTACYENFKAEEVEARKQRVGLWLFTPTPELYAPMGSECPQGCRTHLSGCDIKGNISHSSGEKIFHVPGQQHYENTVVNPNSGERWFCSEEEAIANGWRKAKR